MQLNYNHLYYFHVAAIEGTVAAAAVRLGVTAATVSEQLKTLERALGTDLFDRTPAGLKLTDAGRLTLDHTSGMFRLGERLVEVLGHAPVDSPRMLRVGMSGGIARSSTSTVLLPLFLLDDCVPTVRTGDTVELLRDLRSGILDLVLCESEPSEASRRGLESALIARTSLVAIAPPNLVPAADWNDVGFLQYRATMSYRRDVETFLEANGLRPRVVGEADDSLLLLEVAAHAGFIAVVPRSTARDALAAGRIKIIAQLDPASAAVHAVCQDNVAGELTRRAVSALVAQAPID